MLRPTAADAAWTGDQQQIVSWRKHARFDVSRLNNALRLHHSTFHSPPPVLQTGPTTLSWTGTNEAARAGLSKVMETPLNAKPPGRHPRPPAPAQRAQRAQACSQSDLAGKCARPYPECLSLAELSPSARQERPNPASIAACHSSRSGWHGDGPLDALACPHAGPAAPSSPGTPPDAHSGPPEHVRRREAPRRHGWAPDSPVGLQHAP